jgi:hypothetical protein
MVIWIGQTVTYNEESYHVQDTDFINRAAYIGKPDSNGIVWEPVWVPWTQLQIRKPT